MTTAGYLTVAGCLDACHIGSSFLNPEHRVVDDDDDGPKFQYAGLHFDKYSNATICQCSGILNRLSERMYYKKCFQPCDGNSTQACGTPDRLVLYNLTSETAEDPPRRKPAVPTPTPTPPPTPVPVPVPVPGKPVPAPTDSAPACTHTGSASALGVSSSLQLGAALLALSRLYEVVF